MTTSNDHDQPPTGPEGTWLTLTDLVNMLQITERHARRLVAEKKIPYTKVGRPLRFNLGRILKWLDDNSHGADPKSHGDAA